MSELRKVAFCLNSQTLPDNGLQDAARIQIYVVQCSTCRSPRARGNVCFYQELSVIQRNHQSKDEVWLKNE